MPSKREQVLAALFVRLGAEQSATVRRNEALPERGHPRDWPSCATATQASPTSR
jgi:hypothetical protein